jgi:Tfp pilus assembly protein PilW
VNREELNWLLQTINGAATAERFALVQYEHGRISLEVMADVVRERGWINCAANQFFNVLTSDSSEYASSDLPTVIALGATA